MDSATQVPRLAVSACVRRDDRFLLVERGKQPNLGRWSLPGGHVHFGEALQAAAERELFEETAIRASLDHLVNAVDAIRRDEAGAATHHYVIVVFGGRWTGGEPVAGDDAAKAAWLTIEEARGLPTTRGLLDVLALATERVTAD